MPVAIGSRVGPYEILAAVGAGGMGEVYRARDTKLGRDVALKLLPEAFSSDTQRMARFRREAQVLASLNQPNIASIYGFEDSAGSHALVMELVEGPTLADRIKQGAIPVEEALPIAKQIAEGLEYAHEHGIVHRDLKPANIKLAANDAVKVLDFGLAKALEGDSTSVDISSSPTISRMATQAGIILGTAAYMSPEQAKGKAVDRRTDIWSFGCVLYEMLTGRMAFSGETVTDTLAAVIRAEPDWKALPKATPVHIRVLLQRCLQKDPKQRLQAIGDARIAIEEVLSGAAKEVVRASGETLLAWRSALPWALAAAVVLVLTTYGITRAFFRSNRDVGEAIPARVSLSLPTGAQLAAGNFSPSLAFSPDGKMLAYVAVDAVGVRRLAVRQLDRDQVQVIPGTEGAEGPFFSPDGQWIGYWSHWKIWKVRASGAGIPEAICNSLDFRGGTWAGHTIVFAPSQVGPLFKVADSGGEPQPFTKILAGEYNQRYPHVLPDGDTILFSAWSTPFDPDRAKIVAVSLSTGKRTDIGAGSQDVLYSPPGYLLYVQAGRLLAVPFDLHKLKITGEAKVILDHVVTQMNTGAAQFAVSPEGTLAWISGENVGKDVRLVRVTRSGERSPIFETNSVRRFPRLSPDDRNLLVMATYGETCCTWLVSIDGKEQRHLGTDEFATWFPDGRRWVGYSADGALLVNSIDGTSPRRQLVPPNPNTIGATSVSAGGTVAYDVNGPKGTHNAWLVDAKGGAPKPFLAGPADEGGVQFSPDGRYVAYVSNRSGQFEVYVTSFPDRTATWQISTSGGSEVVWQRDGKEITFRSGPDLIAVPVSTHPTFHAGTPSVLFHVPYDGLLGGPNMPNYDLARDGSWILMIDNPDLNVPAPNIQMAFDWPRVLRAH